MRTPVQNGSRKVLLGMLLLVSSFSVDAGGYYGEGVYFDADISLRYDSNLGRSSAPSDIEEDMITALSAGAGYLKSISPNSQLLISAYLAHEDFAEFDDLNTITANSDIVYTVQPGTGYLAPWYEARLGIRAEKYNKSKIRDGHIIRAGVGAGKRFSDRILLKLDYDYFHRDSDSIVFDTRIHELSGQLVYSFRPAISLFANYNLQVGDVVSTATPNPTIVAAADAVAPDDVFTPVGGPRCMNRRCAYRLDSVGHRMELGMEALVNQYASIDLSAARFIVDGDDVPTYRGWVYRAGLYFQF